MKAMVMGQQKVKNAPNAKLLNIFMVLSIFLFGGWQSKPVKVLNEEQYRLLNDAFKVQTFLFNKTSTTKIWIDIINREWLKDELWFCLAENQEDKEKIIEDLTGSDFSYSLGSHVREQMHPSLIEGKYLKRGIVNLIKQDRDGTVPKISAPFIYEDKALIYYQDPLEEYILYFKKNESGKWERVCIFHIFFVLND